MQPEIVKDESGLAWHVEYWPDGDEHPVLLRRGAVMRQVSRVGFWEVFCEVC